MSKFPLPPLGLFHTFEAVARHRSFTLASDELCLTQSAVSRQIKALEDALGLRLFDRLHRAIDMTVEGQRLFESVTRGLDDISACLAALGATTNAPQITVSASVAFAWFWLMPRLERFGALQPDVDLRVLATDQPVLPGTGEVDVAVLFGAGQWEGLQARLLFGERVYPVCSPAYLRAHPALHRPEDLMDQTLLHLEYGKPSFGGVDWRAWLLRQGGERPACETGAAVQLLPDGVAGGRGGPWGRFGLELCHRPAAGGRAAGRPGGSNAGNAGWVLHLHIPQCQKEPRDQRLYGLDWR